MNNFYLLSDAEQRKALNEAYNLVAPIHIYHAADVCFKKKAEAAIAKLRKGKYHTTPLPTNRLDSLEMWAKENYDTLFQLIVEQEDDTLYPGFDTGGCRGFWDKQGRIVFSGGRIGCFPHYEGAEDLRQRIQDHISDHIQDGPLDDEDDLDE